MPPHENYTLSINSTSSEGETPDMITNDTCDSKTKEHEIEPPDNDEETVIFQPQYYEHDCDNLSSAENIYSTMTMMTSGVDNSSSSLKINEEAAIYYRIQPYSENAFDIKRKMSDDYEGVACVDDNMENNETLSSVSKTKKRKSVGFAHIHIREYNQVLSDHPCCRSGPPISLGWDHVELKSVSMDHYEEHRVPRRTRRQLKMSCDERRDLLKVCCRKEQQQVQDKSSGCVVLEGNQSGYTNIEIKRAERRCYRERQNMAMAQDSVSKLFMAVN
mmetsp:Transcript_35164/g.51646  ORF Transcript_35164/g.51646 Transcript_35164/m.51646 type:complete len:274 (-) Transcript_35164:42-863(-)